MANLKDKVEEFANIAKALPENLQVGCFDLLLKHHLESLSPRVTAHPPAEQPKQKEESPDTKTVEESAKSQEDLAITDLHVT